jgi:hypothetical protein
MQEIWVIETEVPVAEPVIEAKPTPLPVPSTAANTVRETERAGDKDTQENILRQLVTMEDYLNWGIGIVLLFASLELSKRAKIRRKRHVFRPIFNI